MDDNNVKRELFACCITDGILDDMNPEQRIVMIIDITEIKESILKDYQPADSDRKNTSKVSK